ncbi:hypothetical protein LCGC14_1614600, partial [marine sediment metagenome]
MRLAVAFLVLAGAAHAQSDFYCSASPE